jgi:CO dehydrogenase/acetyl-CoA synthase gamma subunit (corrinoid Fe-S protein)
MVDSNGKGLYKRASNKVTYTSKLTKDILNGAISSDELNDYLQKVEVVNDPNLSVHNMICNKNGNVWVIEPGRGTIYSPTDETSYVVMTNFSLWDYKLTGVLGSSGADRYEIAESILYQANDLDVNGAFKILEATKQKEGE